MMEDCQQQIRKYSQMQQYYTSLQNGRMAVPAEEQHLWLIKHKLWLPDIVYIQANMEEWLQALLLFLPEAAIVNLMGLTQ